MSHKSDIIDAFIAMEANIPNRRGEILTCLFEVFESLEWEIAAREIVEQMISEGLEIFVDGNMKAYLDILF